MICSLIGCFGWLALIPLLSPYDQAEQLARSMAAIVNLIFLSAIGLPSLLLILIGTLLSRRNKRGWESPFNRFNFSLSIIGLIVAGVLLVRHAPRLLSSLF